MVKFIYLRLYKLLLKISRLLFAIIGALLIIITGFTILQVENHPLKVSTINQTGIGQYLVNGVQYNTTHITINSANLTLYFQLITPGGNLTSNQPFLFEVNVFFVSSQNSINDIPMNLMVKDFYLNSTALPIKHEINTVLHGKIFQSTYSTVSISQPITIKTLFNASISLTLYNAIGPYYYQSNSMSFKL